MRRIFSLFVLASICIISPAQKKVAIDTTSNKPGNLKVTPNASGVKRSIHYKFSSVNSDTDPGEGRFRYNNEDISRVSYIYLDNNDLSGDDQAKWYSTWEKETGASGRGRVTILDKEEKNVMIFYITDVLSDGKGYWKIPVSNAGGKTPLNDTIYYFIFDRIAHSGETDKEDKEKEKQVVVTVPVVLTDTAKKITETVTVIPAVVTDTVKKVFEVPDVVQEVVKDTVKKIIHVLPVVYDTVKKATEVVKVNPVVAADTVKKVKEVIGILPPAIIDTARKAVEVPKVVPTVVKDTVSKAIIVFPVVYDTVKKVTTVNRIVIADTVKKVIVIKPTIIDTVKRITQVVKPAVVVEQEIPVDTIRKVVAVNNKIQKEPEKKVSQVVPSIRVIPNSTNNKPPQTVQQNITVPNQVKTEIPKNQEIPKTQVVQTKPVVQKTQVSPVTKPVEQKTRVFPVTKPVEQKVQVTTVTKPVEQTAPVTPVSKPVVINQNVEKKEVVNNNQAVNITRPVQNYQTSTVTQPGINQNISSASGAGRTRCYRGIIEVGYGLGIPDYGMNNFRFNFINGFRIGKFSSIGLGIGLRRYFDKPSKHPDFYLISDNLQMPVFLDFRTTFSSKKITPYFAFGIGDSKGLGKSGSKPEGLLLNPSGGIWINVSDRFAVFGGIAWESQKLRYAKFSDNVPFKKSASSISLNIGISF